MNKKILDCGSYPVDFSALIEVLDEHYIFYVQGSDGRLTYVSPSLTRVLGYSQEEFLQDYTTDMTDSPINTLAIEYTQRALAGEAQPPYEVECYAKNGEKRIFEVMEAPVWDTYHLRYSIYGISRDITEAKKAAEKMANNDALLREAERIAHIGSWYLDISTGSLVWSDEVYRIFEVKPEDFGPSYKAFLYLVHPEDREMVEACYKASVRMREPYRVKHRLLMSDGRVKYVSERGENHYDAEGRHLGSTGTVQDITESRLLEMENEKKQKMLFQQSKMAQMGEMLGNIAHQWRQPLSNINSIVLDIDTVYACNRLTKEYLSERLDKIEALTAYMSETITGFQNYFDPRKTKEHFSSCEAVDTAIKLFEADLLQKRIEVIFRNRVKYEIYGYKKEFIQVLLVFLSNAKDALCASSSPAPRIEINCHKANGRFSIDVSDNGGGIAEEHLQRIFEPYFSTKEEDGRGIGLYMAKMIVENSMGGELNVHSADGRTVFTISL